MPISFQFTSYWPILFLSHSWATAPHIAIIYRETPPCKLHQQVGCIRGYNIGTNRSKLHLRCEVKRTCLFFTISALSILGLWFLSYQYDLKIPRPCWCNQCCRSQSSDMQETHDNAFTIVRETQSYFLFLYSARSQSETQDISGSKWESHENISKVNNKFKSAVRDKLAMAIKAKISTSMSPTKGLSTDRTSSKSLPASPAKFSSPNSRTGQKYPNDALSYRRHLSVSSEPSTKSRISDRFGVSCPNRRSTDSVPVSI